MAHADAILYKSWVASREDEILIELIKLQSAIIHVFGVSEQKDIKQRREFTTWLREQDDKELGFMIEMAAYHLDIAMDIRDKKER